MSLIIAGYVITPYDESLIIQIHAILLQRGYRLDSYYMPGVKATITTKEVIQETIEEVANIDKSAQRDIYLSLALLKDQAKRDLDPDIKQNLENIGKIVSKATTNSVNLASSISEKIKTGTYQTSRNLRLVAGLRRHIHQFDTNDSESIRKALSSLKQGNVRSVVTSNQATDQLRSISGSKGSRITQEYQVNTKTVKMPDKYRPWSKSTESKSVLSPKQANINAIRNSLIFGGGLSLILNIKMLVDGNYLNYMQTVTQDTIQSGAVTVGSLVIGNIQSFNDIFGEAIWKEISGPLAGLALGSVIDIGKVSCTGDWKRFLKNAGSNIFSLSAGLATKAGVGAAYGALGGPGGAAVGASIGIGSFIIGSVGGRYLSGWIPGIGGLTPMEIQQKEDEAILKAINKLSQKMESRNMKILNPDDKEGLIRQFKAGEIEFIPDPDMLREASEKYVSGKPFGEHEAFIEEIETLANKPFFKLKQGSVSIPRGYAEFDTFLEKNLVKPYYSESPYEGCLSYILKTGKIGIYTPIVLYAASISPGNISHGLETILSGLRLGKL